MSWVAYVELPESKEYPGRDRVALAHCSRFSPYVEPVGPGRVFLDLGGGAAPPVGIAEGLASRLVPACGQRITLALANSKLTARAMAAAFNARRLPGDLPGLQIHRGSCGDILAVSLGQEPDCLAPLPVEYLWPLGPQVHERLRLLGLTTIGLLAGVPERDLCRQFPAEGSRISLYSRGLDHDPVRPLYPPGRVSYAVPVDEITCKMILRSFLGMAAASLCRELRASNCACRRVVLWLFTGGCSPARQARNFPQAQYEERVLVDALSYLLDKFRITTPVTRLVAVATGLTPLSARQLSLFNSFNSRGEYPAGSGNTSSFRRLAAELQQRYPRVLGWGKGLLNSRREQMLALVDPYRTGGKL